MPRKPKPKPTAKDVRGLKYLKVLQPLLQSLHEVGTQRDTAGNRQLHMDHYCMLILMWLFSPTLSSLRGIQQASTLRKVQRKFKIPRAALGTLSEAPTFFDPEKLKHIAQELGQQIPKIARAEAAEEAGVLADEIIELPVSKRSTAVTHPIRLVSVRCSPHTSRGHYRAGKYSSTAPSSDGVLRILTNELELPAELIALISGPLTQPITSPLRRCRSIGTIFSDSSDRRKFFYPLENSPPKRRAEQYWDRALGQEVFGDRVWRRQWNTATLD